MACWSGSLPLSNGIAVARQLHRSAGESANPAKIGAGYIPLHTTSAAQRLSRFPAGGPGPLDLRITATIKAMGGTKMLKFLIVTFALGAFAMTGLATEAEAQSRPCIKGPKDNLPCPMTHQRPEQVKLRNR